MRKGSWGPWIGAALVAALLVLPGTPGAAGAGGPGRHHLARPTVASTAPHVARRLPHDDDAVAPRSYAGLRPPPDARGGVVVPPHVHLLVARFHVGRTPKVPSTHRMTSLAKQTAAWFHTVSRGRQSVAFKVTPWLSFPGGLSALCSNYSDVTPMVRRLTAAGVNPASYNRLMFVIPQCNTNSLGEIRGRITWIEDATTSLPTMVHELGHNLGLQHAYSLICSEARMRVTLAGSCRPQEYGDLWDAMGISVRPYSVGVLKRLGWAGRVATPRGSGTFTLADAEHSGSKLQGLHVVVSPHRSYWLEFHPETLADSDLPDLRGTPGVQIRVDTGGPSLHILDGSPGNPDGSLFFPDADMAKLTMPVGTSFTTPEHVRITVLSQSASAAKIRIQRGLRATPPGPPTLRGALDLQPGYEHDLYVAPGTAGGQLILGYQVTAHPSNKATYVPLIGGAGILPLLQHFGTSYDVRAVTQQGVSGPSARVALESPGPVITDVTPAEGAPGVDGHQVHLGVTAEPNRLTGSSVASVSACELVAGSCYTYDQDATAPYSVTFPDLAPGPHAFRLTVLDKAGHETEQVRHVQVLGYPPHLAITAPAAGATLSRTFHVTGTAVSANPQSSSPPTVSVELTGQAGDFYLDADPGSTSFDVPFTDIPQGTYTMRVTATDSVDPSDVTVLPDRTVTVAEVRPVISVVTPAVNASLDAREHTFELAVDHPERLSNASAELFVDGIDQTAVYLGQTPYTATIDLSQFAVGSHTLSVTVYDDYFGTWTLTSVPFKVTARVRPVLTMTAPTAGATLSGDSGGITLTADHPEAFDPSPYAYVYVDGGYNNFFYLDQAPYTGTINLSGLAAGNHVLRVEITDAHFGTWSLPNRSFSYTP